MHDLPADATDIDVPQRVVAHFGAAPRIEGGGRSDEALKFDKHVRDFLKATFGDVDNLVSALRVGDRAVDGRLLCAEILRRDETCRIVGAAVDAVAGRKALQALGHALVLVAKHALGNK